MIVMKRTRDTHTHHTYTHSQQHTHTQTHTHTHIHTQLFITHTHTHTHQQQEHAHTLCTHVLVPALGNPTGSQLTINTSELLPEYSVVGMALYIALCGVCVLRVDESVSLKKRTVQKDPITDQPPSNPINWLSKMCRINGLMTWDLNPES